MAFTTPSYYLSELFDRIDRGELQLPDFQRSYGWDVDKIRNLVVTVLRGYPVGAMMALDTRDEPVRFRSRPLTGAPATDSAPGIMLLDGQQRLTSLYLCFQGSGLVDTVDFRAKRIRRRFFVNVTTAVSEDVLPDEAVFTVDEDGYVTSHFGPAIDYPLATREQQVAAGCVPVDSLLGQEGANLLFDIAVDADAEVREAIKVFHHRIVAPLAGYSIPMIRLSRETAQTGIGAIFAHANSPGLEFDIFELLTAVFAVEDPSFSLASAYEEIVAPMREVPVLAGVDRTQFLKALTLVVTARRGVPGALREDILTMSLSDWHEQASVVVQGFLRAAQFLTKRCIFTADQVPYISQLVPLAACLALLDDAEGQLSRQEMEDRLNLWFWSGVFGELYGSSAVTIRSARDVDELCTWLLVSDAETPKTVRDARFAESRLFSVVPDSGVWRGIFALLMARGALDWRTGKPFSAETVEELQPGFETIFPLAWCQRHGVDSVLAESVLNRTPMSKRTEAVLGGYDPTRYLPRVQSKSVMEDDEFDAVLASHELDPELLHRSRAAETFEERRRRLVGMVEYAIDRPVIRDVDESNFAAGSEGPNAFG
ncbi:DUF262 domain-containing protein [Corynebacterium uterequi]|nr:DUF262 domain-containing protein [Corynebacterium uterequi]